MDFEAAEQRIGVSFKDRNILQQAFTHRSYLNENRSASIGHNERLEFLGDAVLELATTEYLYQKYPDQPEGNLTLYRAALVNTDSIADAADKLGFNDFLLLSKGESKDEGRARQYILANSFEAVIGAIHLDQGYETASKFIADNLFYKIDKIIDAGTWIDNKSRFQEAAQDKVSITPAYKTVREEGPDHDKQFTVGVFLNDEKVAEGKGKSKQEAEQIAAKKAIEVKGWL